MAPGLLTALTVRMGLELHGGTLTVESTKGLGTKVIVTLPPDRTRPAQPAPAQLADTASAGKEICHQA